MSDEAAPLRDELLIRSVTSSEVVFEGAVWDVRRDIFELEGETLVREVVDHPGAVAVLALDDEDRALLIRQYRHPVGAHEWEIPAGLLDVEGEDPLVGAQRELLEEADLTADDWWVLTDYFTSPGGMNEAIRIYLARGLHPVPEAERHERPPAADRREAHGEQHGDPRQEEVPDEEPARVGERGGRVGGAEDHGERRRGEQGGQQQHAARSRHQISLPKHPESLTKVRSDHPRLVTRPLLVELHGTVELATPLVLGALAGAAVTGDALALLGTGFCGGLTTFSAFAVQTVERGRWGAASTLALALAFGAVQVWLSGLIVQRYGSGPMERLVRRLVYGPRRENHA